MNLRHAATLALFAWLLLIPPLARSVPPSQSTVAPWKYLNECAGERVAYPTAGAF